MPGLSPAEYGSPAATGGRRHRGVSVKTLKRALKKAGMKVSGKKAALTRRAKKAHLLKGGVVDPMAVEEKMMGGEPEDEELEGGRRRSRKNGLVRGVYRGVTGVAKGTLRSVGRVGRSVFGRGK